MFDFQGHRCDFEVGGGKAVLGSIGPLRRRPWFYTQCGEHFIFKLIREGLHFNFCLVFLRFIRWSRLCLFL